MVKECDHGPDELVARHELGGTRALTELGWRRRSDAQVSAPVTSTEPRLNHLDRMRPSGIRILPVGDGPGEFGA